MDPIADMLSSIKNASIVKKEFITTQNSSLKMAILEVLKKGSYITDFKIVNNEIKIELAYEGDKSKIAGVKRVSKPSRRVYVKKSEIPKVLSGYGLAVISTPKGVFDGAEATKRNLGGELLLEIW